MLPASLVPQKSTNFPNCYSVLLLHVLGILTLYPLYINELLLWQLHSGAVYFTAVYSPVFEFGENARFIAEEKTGRTIVPF